MNNVFLFFILVLQSFKGMGESFSLAMVMCCRWYNYGLLDYAKGRLYLAILTYSITVATQLEFLYSLIQNHLSQQLFTIFQTINCNRRGKFFFENNLNFFSYGNFFSEIVRESSVKAKKMSGLIFLLTLGSRIPSHFTSDWQRPEGSGWVWEGDTIALFWG